MFPSSFPFFDYQRDHRHGHGGIYNNLIVNAPQHECRHEYWRPPYYYPMPIINETINTTQIQGQGQGQRQGQIS
jgi:hypothetical protein